MTVRPRSLQARLLALVLGAVVMVWLVTAVVTWRDAQHELDELLDGHLAQAAALLIVQQAREVEGDEVADAPSLHRYGPRVAFQVFHEGRLALRSANAPSTPMIDRREGFASARIGDATWRVFAARGAERDVQVYVAELATARSSILRAVLYSMLWPAAIALPILALAVAWAVVASLAPLRRLGAALARREPNDRDPLPVDDPPSELRPLVAALDALFGRIGVLLDAERRFTADAAHELRTPIAATRAQAQVALAEADDERRRHALRATLDGCDRAARLVDQLLALARLDAEAAAQANSVDLAAVVRRVAAEIAPAAVAKRQALEVDAPPACPLRGDDTLLAVLVRNLLDNAVRYSPQEARIRVTLRCDAGVVMTVEDSGPGLSSADLARLGERFFRVPGNVEAGSGLGWSIVRRIADAHRLDVSAARSELGGLAVRVATRGS